MNLVEMEALERDLALLESLAEQAKILTYRPNPNQAPFHVSRAAGRICTGSNRSGKTAGSIAEAISCALGERLWVPQDAPERRVYLGSGQPMPVPNMGRIFAEEFKTIEETILPAFKEWCPRSYLKQVKHGQRGYPERITLTNGSIIYLRVYKQDVESQEGSKHHWVMLDEPPPYDLFIAVRRGLLDFHGLWWMALTPLSEPWIWDTLVAKAGPGQPIEHFSYSIYNNGPPYGPMTQQAIDEFISVLDESEYESRILGNPRYLVGRVFPEWRPERPYYVPSFRVPPFWQRYCVIDPHPRKPFAVLWLAFDPETDTTVAYDELFDKRLRTCEDVADAIFEKERVHKAQYESFERSNINIRLRLIDTAAEELERGSGVSIRDELARCGIHTLKAHKHNKFAGYELIRQALKISPRTKSPQLLVFTTCKELAANFLKHIWSDWVGPSRDSKEQKQDVVTRDDDFIACLRYFYQRGLARGAAAVIQRQPYQPHYGQVRPGLWAGV